MSLSNVKCTVANCRYWQNENCQATGIEVNVDEGGKQAKDSMHTQCHTFEQK